MLEKRELVKKFFNLSKVEEDFHKQKTKAQWLYLGDKNTKFFQRSLLHTQIKSKIHWLTNETRKQVHDKQSLSYQAVH